MSELRELQRHLAEHGQMGTYSKGTNEAAVSGGGGFPESPRLGFNPLLLRMFIYCWDVLTYSSVRIFKIRVSFEFKSRNIQRKLRFVFDENCILIYTKESLQGLPLFYVIADSNPLKRSALKVSAG